MLNLRETAPHKLRLFSLLLFAVAILSAGVLIGRNLRPADNPLVATDAHAQEALGPLRNTADVAALVTPSVVNVFTTRSVNYRAPSKTIRSSAASSASRVTANHSSRNPRAWARA